jgi:hypothetical protein
MHVQRLFCTIGREATDARHCRIGKYLSTIDCDQTDDRDGEDVDDCGHVQ